MRSIVGVLLCAALIASGCKSQAADPGSGLTADIHVQTPFAGNIDGKLHIRSNHLRVDAGETIVFDAAQGSGWASFPDSKQYWDVDWKDVSTFLPRRANGSPCLYADNPANCKADGKEKIEGRAATKWEVVNQFGRRVYLWSDDETGIALRWQIETVTYSVDHIKQERLQDTLFQLPSDLVHVAKPFPPTQH